MKTLRPRRRLSKPTAKNRKLFESRAAIKADLQAWVQGLEKLAGRHPEYEWPGHLLVLGDELLVLIRERPKDAAAIRDFRARAQMHSRTHKLNCLDEPIWLYVDSLEHLAGAA